MTHVQKRSGCLACAFHVLQIGIKWTLVNKMQEIRAGAADFSPDVLAFMKTRSKEGIMNAELVITGTDQLE